MSPSLVGAVHWISRCLSVLSQIAIVFMTVSTLYDVLMRYAFSRPTIWAVELNAALLVIVTFLASAELVHRDQHIQMDTLYDRLGPTTRRIVGRLVDLSVLLFCGALVWMAGDVTETVYRSRIYSAGAFRFPMWIPYATITLGTLVMAVEYSIKVVVGASPAPAAQGDRA